MPTRSLPPILSPLTLAILLSLSICTVAQADEGSGEHVHDVKTLDAIQVTASPLRGDAESLARPVEILSGEALDKAKRSTLGETVAKLPGVQSTFFGAGVGRPIIRGQDGPRVQVLAAGIGAMDVSTLSADHAVSIEPFLADQIEVLKGPATLLYGSGAIGGAVNVVDGRIPEFPADTPLGGRAELRGNTGNDEATGMLRVDGGNARFGWHADGFHRDAGDYRIPGEAIADHDEHADDVGDEDLGPDGRLANSALTAKGGSVGGSWFGDGGYIGAALSTYRSDYGIPDGAHIHTDEEHDHDAGAAEDASVRIALEQQRFDIKAGLDAPVPFLESVTLRAAYNDYQHVELEGGAPATRFANTGHEGRLEAVQAEIHGWRGAFGLQFGHVDFSAFGEEAFVPASRTDTLGLFALQERDIGPVKLELGARHDRNRIAPEGGDALTFGATSLSAATIWRIDDNVDLRAGLDHSERTPTTEELFADGPHIATRSHELGDPGLAVEQARRAELGVHVHHGDSEFKFALYQTNFTDFTYLADTGIVEDALPVRVWAQADTTFRGAEAEALFTVTDNTSGRWDLRLFGDYVVASFDGDATQTTHVAIGHGDHVHNDTAILAQRGPLPRIAPARIGTDLNWSRDGWRASVGAVRYSGQDRVAAHETPSAAYTLVDAHLAYHWDTARGGWEVFLDGSNLGNQEARPHTSLLKDLAPLPGRGVAFGVRAFF